MNQKRFLLLALAAFILSVGCTNGNEELHDRLDDHEQRITDLENTVAQLEGQIKEGALISGVTALPAGSGWRLAFTGGTKPYIDVLNGGTPLVEVKNVGNETHIFVDGKDTGINVKGSDGPAPHIGQNGNWFIGSTDTGVKAEGPAGTTPHIGSNGNWFVGSEDTGVKAEGPTGTTPHIGSNGNWFVGSTDTGVKAEGPSGTTPHIGPNGNWFVGSTNTGVKAEGPAGAEAFVKFDVAGDAANGNAPTVWYTTKDKAELPPSVENGWVALYPVAAASPVAMITDNKNGTITITMNDAANNAPEPATAFTFAKGSTAVRFEMLNYADTVGIGENDTTRTLRFLVNPSTAWIPTTDDGGIDKWYLNSVDRTRAPGYVVPSTDFRITKIEPSPKGKGEYIATIAELDGGSGHATLVLDVASANDTEPVLISSSVFYISGSGDIPQPEPGPDQGRLFHIEDSDRSQYALADETRTNVGQFLFRSSVAWRAEVIGGVGTHLGLEPPAVSWLRLMVNGQESYSGPAGDMPVFIELDRNDTDYMREATVIFSPESGGENIPITVRQEATDRNG